MSFQPGVFYFENECKEVVDIKLCTFRLWKGGNQYVGTLLLTQACCLFLLFFLSLLLFPPLFLCFYVIF